MLTFRSTGPTCQGKINDAYENALNYYYANISASEQTTQLLKSQGQSVVDPRLGYFGRPFSSLGFTTKATNYNEN